MTCPVHRLSKKEIVWLASHKCKHRHTYLSHFNCYEEEVLKGRKVQYGKERLPVDVTNGYFDIESTGFQATFSYLICYCIKDGNSDKIYERTVTKKELETCLDREVVRQCVDDLKRFDRIITFYGTRFDLPFIRSRAVYWGIPFPHFKTLLHTDVYFIIRNRFKLHRNSLDAACNFLLPEEVQASHQKSHFGRDHWVWATQGKKESLNYIVQHCRDDVKMLEDLYKVVEDYAMRTDRSI